ncbi:MAG: hypothetical protein ACTSXE_02575 [Candidatus Thorarchaeota archaeon]
MSDKKFTIEEDESHPARSEIWNKVCESEMFGDDLGDMLKQVSHGGAGSRKYTSIDAYVQVKKLTEIFGPIGKGWGISEIDRIFDTPMTKHTRRGDIEGVQVFFRFKFWYILNGSHETYLLNDIFVDASGDSGKKLVTDCITKAASYLGFNYDVFCGRFNDVKTIQSPATKDEKDALIASMKGMKEARRKAVVEFHEKHEWNRDEVIADTKKFMEIKAKVAQMKEEKDTPAEEA